MRPVLFFAFANHQDAYLALLKEESKEINAALQYLHDKQAVEVYREESAGVNELLAGLNRFKDRVTIFHYAGHANGGGLEFEGGAGNAAGVAQLLAELPQLQLVFLNGCSTLPQVDYLMQKGVKAVIATSTPINDGKAVEFSEHFYRALANKNTIASAFRFAVNALKTKYGGEDLAAVIQYRGFKPAGGEAMPWGLYLNENATGINDWTLPTDVVTSAPRPKDDGYEANKYIVDVLPEIARFDAEVDRVAFDANGKFILENREALAMVIEKFPWPIGIQIRQLSSNDAEMNGPTLTRLRHIASTYLTTTQFLFYVLLSQIWNMRKEGDARARLQFLDALNLTRQHFPHYDYFSKALQAVEALQRAGENLYLEELGELAKQFTEKGELYDAYLYLESLRQRLENPNTAALEAELGSLCADGEYYLSSVLISLAFLVKYPLIIVRDINISNPRHKQPEFNHFIGRLNVNSANTLTISRKPRAYATYMASSSVILVKDLNNTERYLNLSPFIIDKNAYASSSNPGGDAGMVPHIYLYAFREGNEYRYLTTTHSVYRALETEADQLSTGEEDRAEVRNRERIRDRSATLQRSAPEVNKPYGGLREQFDAFIQLLAE